MFACTTFESRIVAEDDLMNKVLSEGLKLKAKCKSLGRLLADTEQKRRNDAQNFEAALTQQRVESNICMASLCAKHAGELDKLLAEKHLAVQLEVKRALESDQIDIKKITSDFESRNHDLHTKLLLVEREKNLIQEELWRERSLSRALHSKLNVAQLRLEETVRSEKIESPVFPVIELEECKDLLQAARQEIELLTASLSDVELSRGAVEAAVVAVLEENKVLQTRLEAK